MKSEIVGKPVNIEEVAEFDAKTHRKIDLLRCSAFNVVEICFEPGQRIPPHEEPYSVLFLILEGDGTITTGNGERRVKSNDLIFVQKGGIRGISAKTRMRMLGIQEPH